METVINHRRSKTKTREMLLGADGSPFGYAFRPDQGAQEYFLVTTAPNRSPFFSEQVRSVLETLTLNLGGLDLDLDSIVWCNFYVSDIANHHDELLRSDLYQKLRAQGAAISVLQCAPVDSKISLVTYHVKSQPSLRKKFFALKGSAEGLSLSSPQAEYIYLKNFLPQDQGDIVGQSEQMFDQLRDYCAQNKRNKK